MIVLANILAGLTLLVFVSSTLYAVSAEVWVVSAAIVVACHTALRRSFSDAALVMIVVIWAEDLLASGPPGLHALTLTLVFFAMYAIAQRAGGTMVLVIALLAFGAAFVMMLGEAFLIGLFYADAQPLRIFLSAALPSALVTALVAVPYAYGMHALEQLYQRRSERSVIVD